MVEPEDEPEAVAQRLREQARARRRADQRERREVEPQAAGARPLAHDDVDDAVLHGRVQRLLDGAVEPVHLVDEDDVVIAEVGEDRDQVALAVEARPARP